MKKICGIYINEEGTLEVMIQLPAKWAASHGLEEQWELEVQPSDAEDLQTAVIEQLEDEFLQLFDDVDSYNDACEFLNNADNWAGEIEEGHAIYDYETIKQHRMRY